MSTWSDTVTALAPNGWWRLGESSGDAIDSGSGGNNGTVGTGGFTRAQTSLVPNDTANKSCKIDGNNVAGTAGFLMTDVYDFTNTTSFSLAAAINTDGTGAGLTRRIIEKISTNGWRFAVSTADKILFQRITSSGTTSVIGTTVFSTGTTYFLTVTYDGTDMKLYVNGASDLSPTASSYNLDNTAGVMSLGCTSGRLGPFGGTLDEVMLWSGTALTSANVTTLWSAFNAKLTTAQQTVTRQAVTRAATY